MAARSTDPASPRLLLLSMLDSERGFCSSSDLAFLHPMSASCVVRKRGISFTCRSPFIVAKIGWWVGANFYLLRWLNEGSVRYFTSSRRRYQLAVSIGS
jgi:hypothetical protein